MKIELTNLNSKSQSEILYVLTGLLYQSKFSTSRTTVEEKEPDFLFSSIVSYKCALQQASSALRAGMGG